MSDENNPPLTPAEHAQLLQRFPRIAYWVGEVNHHPDIHVDVDDGQAAADPQAPSKSLTVALC